MATKLWSQRSGLSMRVFPSLVRRRRHLSPWLSSHKQIGRASCRERACQYVKIRVLAVPLKKQKNQLRYENGSDVIRINATSDTVHYPCLTQQMLVHLT